jgi:predicted nuclease of predicted toxin-antitoxin system
MKVLFDQNVPAKVRQSLQDHIVKTAADMAWSTLKNGDLLTAAESAGFEVLLTCDQSIRYQQNLKDRTIAIVLIDTNDWKVVRRHVSLIERTIASATQGEFLSLEIART